jgi:hypothetical protein
MLLVVEDLLVVEGISYHHYVTQISAIPGSENAQTDCFPRRSSRSPNVSENRLLELCVRRIA